MVGFDRANIPHSSGYAQGTRSLNRPRPTRWGPSRAASKRWMGCDIERSSPWRTNDGVFTFAEIYLLSRTRLLSAPEFLSMSDKVT